MVACADVLLTLGFISSHWDKLSSEDAVKRVLAGEKGDGKGRPSLTSRPQEVDNRNAGEEAPRAPRDGEVSGRGRDGRAGCAPRRALGAAPA